jgi:hypothetical protein
VATRFIGNVEIAASRAPFRAVRSDSPSSSAKLREQMRKLVSQRAIDLVNRQSGSDTVIRKSRVQRDYLLAKICATGRGLQVGIPFDSNLARKFRGAELAQQISRFFFKRVIAPLKL